MPKINAKKQDSFRNILNILQQLELSYNLTSGINKKQLRKIKSKVINVLAK
jgi:hypothetical protein